MERDRTVVGGDRWSAEDVEHFDGLGQLRTLENGTPIDVSADIDGAKFIGAQGLGKYLHNDPRVPKCLVRQLFPGRHLEA